MKAFEKRSPFTLPKQLEHSTQPKSYLQTLQLKPFTKNTEANSQGGNKFTHAFSQISVLQEPSTHHQQVHTNTSEISTSTENYSPNAIEKETKPDLYKRERNLTGMPDALKSGLEILSGLDLSDVRVHRNSPEPDKVNALAFTQGNIIHLSPNQETSLPHEGWHVVQQLQGRVKTGKLQLGSTLINHDPNLEKEADQMGEQVTDLIKKPLHSLSKINIINPSKQPTQRQVRIDNDFKRVKEEEYLYGGSKSTMGSRARIANLILDDVPRVFENVDELEDYANGKTDYIGDVKTESGHAFWYRLPKDELTVLGEDHTSKTGKVEDVVLGLQIKKFMFEPYHDLTDIEPLKLDRLDSGTKKRMLEVESERRSAKMATAYFLKNTVRSPIMKDAWNLANIYDPNLENTVIKVLTGTTAARTEFMNQYPDTESRKNMSLDEKEEWGGKKNVLYSYGKWGKHKTGYSYGERLALYFSMAIHIANDISKHDFSSMQQPISDNYIKSAQLLSEFYLDHKSTLDEIMELKDQDKDGSIGIFELTGGDQPKNIQLLIEFSIKFHEFGSQYITQLGEQTNNETLQKEGQKLSQSSDVDVKAFHAAREEIMWKKIQDAKSMKYRIVGMGDAHRKNLKSRLEANGIRHKQVDIDMATQMMFLQQRYFEEENKNKKP